MTVSKQSSKQAAKARYAHPELTVFGSVRNLTGGSGGTTSGDGTTMDMKP